MCVYYMKLISGYRNGFNCIEILYILKSSYSTVIESSNFNGYFLFILTLLLYINFIVF